MPSSRPARRSLFVALTLATCGAPAPDAPPAALAEPAPTPAPAPPTDPTYASYLRARALLDQALAAHGELTGPLWWRARGTIAVEGHYKKPYEVHTKPWEEVVERRDDAISRRVKYDDEHEGVTICAGERGFFRDFGDPPTDQRSAVVRQCDALARALPQQLLRRVLDHASSLRWLGEGDDGGVVHNVLTYADASGSASLWLRRDDHRLARWERLVAHPQLGDGAESVRYADYREFAGVLLPARRVERWLHEDAADTRDVTLELVERVSHEDLAPAEAETHWSPLAGADPPPAPRPPAKVVALSPALFLVELRSRTRAPPSPCSTNSSSCSTPRCAAPPERISSPPCVPMRRTRKSAMPCSDITTRTTAEACVR
ncbi:hypothetical protein [Nannocystis pusilla]|uniref:hypothetical protein n=1 Tax=Nannocystis pusilla TaxID=889268 RepID=UPI003DA1D706